MVKENAYAKLNLSLKVLGKTDDGFHELKSIMVPVVDLYDELYFEENDTFEFNLENDNIKNNSILKAAKAFQEKYKTKGANIRLVKRIPLEAGLGGGSADSSATLRGLNKLFNLNIPLEELEELASSLGSDNVFCLYNKTAICTGRGEKLEFIDSEFSFDVLLIKPEFGLSTKDVFNNLKIKTNQLDLTAQVLKALEENDIKLLNDEIFNDLLIPAIEIKPELGNIIKFYNDSNIKVHMSGSGTTLYVILDENTKNTLEEITNEYGYFKKHVIKNNVKG